MTTKNILSLCETLNHFQRQIKTIHVGGTNGKGTTSYEIYLQLISQGYQVGLYHSPFISERFDNIEVNLVGISTSKLLKLLTEYDNLFHQFNLTEFEIDTFIAYRYFYEEKVDYAIIEVGLGGLHDATNIMTPILSVITSIGTDHKELIGPTILDIAREKAGIIKAHVPIVIGSDFNYDVKELIKNEANLMHAPFIELRPQEQFSSFLKHNHALAHLVLKTLGLEVKLLNPKTLPFRLERVNQFILDGAHNIEAVIELVKWLKNESLKPIVIMSTLKKKPYENMFKLLNKVSKKVYVTTFQHEDAIQKFDLNDVMKTHFVEFDELHHVFKKYPHDTILLTGSLYFLRSIYKCYKEMIYANH